MRNLRLSIAYDGAAYRGWQYQPRVPTVQGAIEAVLQRMTRGGTGRLRAAGRTDAGVHAEGQVAHFFTESALRCDVFRHGLNALLPDDIAVHAVDEVPLEFDVRRSARGKHYRYCIWNTWQRSIAWRGRALHVRRELDLAQMARAATLLVGMHDFAAFRAADCDRETTVRTLFRCSVSRDGPLVSLDVEGTAFLKHMVRVIAGTLIDVGLRRRPADQLVELLQQRDRRQAGMTAPAHGLSLVEVFLS